MPPGFFVKNLTRRVWFDIVKVVRRNRFSGFENKEYGYEQAVFFWLLHFFGVFDGYFPVEVGDSE
jgi:hypothetical protein